MCFFCQTPSECRLFMFHVPELFHLIAIYALQNFNARMYDLIILDVLMKGLDGFALYNKIRNIDANVQVCFITASNTFYEKYKKLYPGMEKECFIQKPIKIKNLATIIDSI